MIDAVVARQLFWVSTLWLAATAACLADNAVLLHVLTRCELGQIVLQDGDRLPGDCTVTLVGAQRDGCP